MGVMVLPWDLFLAQWNVPGGYDAARNIMRFFLKGRSGGGMEGRLEDKMARVKNLLSIVLGKWKEVYKIEFNRILLQIDLRYKRGGLEN